MSDDNRRFDIDVNRIGNRVTIDIPFASDYEAMEFFDRLTTPALVSLLNKLLPEIVFIEQDPEYG